VFRRTSGTGKKNMDGMQAIWEHVNGRPMVYPKPRLVNPAFMDPANYEWSKVDGASNVAEKLFAVSSERGAETRIVKFESGAHHTLRGRAVYYTLSGRGTVGSEPLRVMTSFYLDAGESVHITAHETMEILQLGMPKLSGMTASVGQAAA
jgi:mannose-6-phosphate isomerase-like protein (cupin superfamily)